MFLTRSYVTDFHNILCKAVFSLSQLFVLLITVCVNLLEGSLLLDQNTHEELQRLSYMKQVLCILIMIRFETAFVLVVSLSQIQGNILRAQCVQWLFNIN